MGPLLVASMSHPVEVISRVDGDVAEADSVQSNTIYDQEIQPAATGFKFSNSLLSLKK